MSSHFKRPIYYRVLNTNNIKVIASKTQCNAVNTLISDVTICFYIYSNEWFVYMPGLARLHHAAVGDRGGGHPAVQVQHLLASTVQPVDE